MIGCSEAAAMGINIEHLVTARYSLKSDGRPGVVCYDQSGTPALQCNLTGVLCLNTCNPLCRKVLRCSFPFDVEPKWKGTTVQALNFVIWASRDIAFCSSKHGRRVGERGKQQGPWNVLFLFLLMTRMSTLHIVPYPFQVIAEVRARDEGDRKHTCTQLVCDRLQRERRWAKVFNC